MLFLGVFSFSIFKNYYEKKNNLDFEDLILLFGALICFGATVFHGTDAPVTRYVLPAIVFFIVFLGRNLRKIDMLPTLLVLLAAFALIIGHIKYNMLVYRNASATLDPLINFLKKEQIKDCLSNYELGTSLIFLLQPTGFVNAPVHINTEKKKIEETFFLSKRSWYLNPKRCYISSNREEMEEIKRIFGSNYEFYEFFGGGFKGIYLNSEGFKNFYVMLYPTKILSLNENR